MTARSVAGLKVLVTTDCVGGVWTYAVDLARGLSERGARVTLAILGPGPGPADREAARSVPGLDLVETGLPLDWLAESPDAIRSAGEALARLARARGADLVHLNSPAFAAERPFAEPVVAFCHSCLRTWWDAVRGTALDPDFVWRADMVGRGYRAADALVAPSRSFAHATAAAYGLARVPDVVRNGRAQLFPPPCGEGGLGRRPSRVGVVQEAPPSLHSEPPPPRSDASRPLGPPHKGEGKTAPFVFTAGRLWDEGKDVATLDRAAAGLACPVLAAGSQAGPNGAGVALRHARPLGRIGAEEVATYLAARPIFCSPALYEPFGLAVLEAAAAGCPLVLSDIPTFRELWDGAAIFVPVRDSRALAAALSALAADPARQASLGAAARERAGRYTAAGMVEGILAIYEEVLASGGRAAARPWSLAS